MIDYDKLRIAHTLASKYSDIYHVSTSIKIIYMSDGTYGFIFKGAALDTIRGLDDIITTLQELTQSKAKYEDGAEVWFVVLGINWTPIQAHTESYQNGKYYVAGNWYREEELYPTKSALIEAQIEYWHKQLCQELECDVLINVSYEGEIKGFDANYALSDEGQSKIKEGLRQLIKECQHEPEMDIGKDSRPRLEKGKNPKCKHCGELYSMECQHESDGKYYESCNSAIVQGAIFKCLKCGEFYR